VVQDTASQETEVRMANRDVLLEATYLSLDWLELK